MLFAVAAVALPMPWLKERAPGLHRFLTRRDRPYPILREALGVVLVLLLLVAVLFGVTGQPLSGGYPVVVVTSGSMMHCRNADADGVGPSWGSECDPERYGRVGFIDPGDLIFVRDVDERDDVLTKAAGGKERYGNAGDVVVFRLNGRANQTPIIHRALFWLEAHGDGTFSVPELGIHRTSDLGQPAITQLTRCVLQPSEPGGRPLGPASSGFITRGDNNPYADQCLHGLGTGPVRMSWVLGKARGELPWLGLIKLFVDDVTGNTSNFSRAGADSKVMLALTVGALVVVPWGVDIGLRRRRRRRAEAEPAAEPAEPKPPAQP
jgi:signal peptidase I